jgi:hypothetical protein
MKYTPELTDRITKMYQGGDSALSISIALESEQLGNGKEFEAVPERSIIAKLSSLGVYQKKVYKTKQGDVPVKKGEYIERIAVLLDVNAEILESLEKVNKNVLALLSAKLDYVKSAEAEH